MKDNLIKIRRDLHKIPELDIKLPKTTAYLTDYLEKLPCTIKRIGKAGFVAYFDKGKDKTIAFRTDMDALPVQEETGHDFQSVHDGRMHACGHDGHMSIMLGFASEIANLNTNSNVLLVFQAAEETTGGAKEICDSKVFKKYNTVKIYGLHIWPGFPKHTIACRGGDLMAGNKNFWINIDGKSSHAAKSDEGIDALEIAAELVHHIYDAEQKEFPDDVERVLKFCTFNSGTGINIISGKTEMSGTIRFTSMWTLRIILSILSVLCKRYEDEYKCSIELTTSEGYPPVINPAEMVDELEEVVSSLSERYDTDYFSLEKPLLTSEDFSFYQQKIPGLFFLLGTGMDAQLHNGSYDIDEDVLPLGVEIFKALLANA